MSFLSSITLRVCCPDLSIWAINSGDLRLVEIFVVRLMYDRYKIALRKGMFNNLGDAVSLKPLQIFPEDYISYGTRYRRNTGLIKQAGPYFFFW